MSPGISRDQALDLLHRHIKNPNMIKHCLASEAVLGALADRLGEDRGKCGPWPDCSTTWMWS